jgi:hypothetical protein
LPTCFHPLIFQATLNWLSCALKAAVAYFPV